MFENFFVIKALYRMEESYEARCTRCTPKESIQSALNAEHILVWIVDAGIDR